MCGTSFLSPSGGPQYHFCKDLKDDIFIMPPKATDLRLIAERACIHAGYHPNIGYITSGNIDLTLRIAREQNMVYLAFKRVIDYYPTEGCIIIPLAESISSWTAFVTLKKKYFREQPERSLNFWKKNILNMPFCNRCIPNLKLILNTLVFTMIISHQTLIKHKTGGL